MSIPTPRLDAMTRDALDEHLEWAEKYAERTRDKWESVPWSERTVADVFAGKAMELRAAERRVKNLGDNIGQLAVVVIPARIEDPRAWEAKARELDSKGRAAIEATAKPLPPKGK